MPNPVVFPIELAHCPARIPSDSAAFRRIACWFLTWLCVFSAHGSCQVAPQPPKAPETTNLRALSSSFLASFPQLKRSLRPINSSSPNDTCTKPFFPATLPQPALLAQGPRLRKALHAFPRDRKRFTSGSCSKAPRSKLGRKRF